MYRMTAAILANGRKIARQSDGYRCAQPMLRTSLLAMTGGQAYADLRTALSTSVLPNDQIAPGTL